MLSRLWKILLGIWAFIADTAQILGVEWKQVIPVVATSGVGAWVIGFLNGFGAFQLAIGVSATMFFVAGASAFSRYKKSGQHGVSKPPVVEAKSSLRTTKNNPLYATPIGQEDFPIGSISFKDLGDMMIKLSQEINRDLHHLPYNAAEKKIVNDFLSRFGPRVFWLYGEAKNRGLENSYLEKARECPGSLYSKNQIELIGDELEKFGNIVRLYV